MKPQMVSESAGMHNLNLEQSIARLYKGRTYKDLSTICIVPTRGVIPAKVVQCWMGMLVPMNQKFTRIFMCEMEVGQAYNTAIEMILANPELNKWKYILTLEEDNMPPPDGLLKLYENIETYDAVSGLYWTKGEGGQPMIYGNPQEIPKNFIPQIPLLETVQQCNGLGMGFCLFKIEMFKDIKITKPYFRTVQEYVDGQGVKCYTQDLFFFEKAGNVGHKFAVDTRVKVGHYDLERDMVW
jgi:hypothetical protein